MTGNSCTTTTTKKTTRGGKRRCTVSLMLEVEALSKQVVSYLQVVVRGWHVTGVLQELGHVRHNGFLLRAFNINI